MGVYVTSSWGARTVNGFPRCTCFGSHVRLNPATQEITDLKKRMAAMENRRTRSRSPRRQQQQSRVSTGFSFLPLPAPASSSYQPAPGQDKKKKGQRKGEKGSKSKGVGSNRPMKFAEIMEGPIENKAHVHQRFHYKEMCFDLRRRLAIR